MDGPEFDRTQARQLFLAFVNNLPAVFMKRDKELDIQAETESGATINLGYRACYFDQELIHETDRPLLLWLLREALKWGTPHVSWAMLVRSLGDPPSEEGKWTVYESALRISAAAFSYRQHYQAQGSSRLSLRGGNSSVAQQRKLAQKAPEPSRRGRGKIGKENPSAEPVFYREISFEFDKGFLEMAECAFNRRTLEFEGCSHVAACEQGNLLTEK